MKNVTLGYIGLVLSHMILGVLIFAMPFLSKIYLISILFVGLIYVVKKQNRNNEVLLVAGYIVGAEVFLRATGGAVFYDFSKYGVITMMFVGMFYSGFSKNAIPYWIYLLLLIPGVILATTVLKISADDRKVISFAMTGPVCLGISALYTYQRKIHINTVNSILLTMGLPIVSLTTFLILYAPSVKEVVTGTSSNFDTSGGFGPNQVSTVLGLGLFIFVSRLILQSKDKIQLLVNAFLVAVIAYRGLVTFSRGGMITGFVMILFFIANVYFFTNFRGRVRLNYFAIAGAVTFFAIWSYGTLQTNGMIAKRYANQDVNGKVKEDQLTGRGELMELEWGLFLQNPALGVGVGRSVEIRKQKTGDTVASHDEITRLLAEHGSLGVAALLILFITPLILFIDNKQHIFMFSFYLFWMLTINHAAMRIAAPAFIYSLSLLKVYMVVPERKKQEMVQIADETINYN